MIYDIVAYSKPTDVPQNIGNIIKRLRVSSEDDEGIEIVNLVNNFFADVDLSALNIAEPAITILGSLSKVATEEEVNDLLGTLRFYGIYFSIIALPGLSEEVSEDPETQCLSYITLGKAYHSETFSVPILYTGAVTAYKTIPTLGVMLLEVLKQLPLPTTFSKFTSVKGLIDFYSTVGADDASYVRINDITKALESLGYSYLGVIL